MYNIKVEDEYFLLNNNPSKTEKIRSDTSSQSNKAFTFVSNIP